MLEINLLQKTFSFRELIKLLCVFLLIIFVLVFTFVKFRHKQPTVVNIQSYVTEKQPIIKGFIKSQYAECSIVTLNNKTVCLEKNNTAIKNLVKNNIITADFDQVRVQDALYLLAIQDNINVVISPFVKGYVTLHIENILVKTLFDYILQAYGLTKYKDQNVWFILPYAMWLEWQQQHKKQLQQENEFATLYMRVWPIRYSKAKLILTALRNEQNSLLTKKGYAYCDIRTNRIIVRDTTSALNQIDAFIKKLDVPVEQILIEARLASIDNDFERELGIHFSNLISTMKLRATANSYSLAVARLADNSLLDMQLAALERQGKGELISSPSLFTANHQTASIEAGEEIPYQEISQTGTVGVTFKKAVLSLKVTPQILPHQNVLLQLQVTQDKPSRREILGVPTISTRQISTSIVAPNGQTMVLGGIFESNKDEFDEGLPLLNKIPLVGWLFHQQNVARNKRELLIFVTPRIVNMAGSCERKT